MHLEICHTVHKQIYFRLSPNRRQGRAPGEFPKVNMSCNSPMFCSSKLLKADFLPTPQKLLTESYPVIA